MIELLTQLSPGSCRASPMPTLTVTSTPSQTPSPYHAPRFTPGLQEDSLLSPSSTLDSRCSSRTKSSGRSSTCGSKGALVSRLVLVFSLCPVSYLWFSCSLFVLFPVFCSSVLFVLFLVFCYCVLYLFCFFFCLLFLCSLFVLSLVFCSCCSS